MTHISIVECPRDAWQGFQDFIPTQEKINHIKMLANCGFHTIDAGSFVSPRAMPQMVDARPLFTALEEVRATSDTKLLSILASEGGARRATEFDFIDAWGYPFSVSEEFQLRNSRKNIKDGMEDLKRVKELADRHNVELVVYLSMAFGNPYGEEYHRDLVLERLLQAESIGADLISLSDTTGEGTTEKVVELCDLVKKESAVPWGAHMHSTYDEASAKAQAAINAGCTRIDTALRGFGGCPFASDALIGNMPTEKVLTAIEEMNEVSHGLDPLALESAYNSALNVFSGRH
jgi:hydroxymethylglutaryl-CoA lyase